MTDNYGRTALHHAALNGNLEACMLLIERGARLDARARDGKTPFNYAAQVLCSRVVHVSSDAGGVFFMTILHPHPDTHRIVNQRP